MDLHVPTGASALDQQLQQYLRRAAPHGRDTAQIGPFLATFHQHSDNPYLSFAIPEDGARPTAEDVSALVAAYEARGRTPRLEYLPAAAPAVEAALVAGGFTVEARLPAMTCGPDEAVDLAPPAGIEIAAPETDADLWELDVALHAAFDQGPPEPDAVARKREWLEGGALAVLARDAETRAVVGGGMATVPHDGVTELAGIGVIASHRRRGIAGAVTARLARDAFAIGVTTAFLTPGGEGAHRVYARAGFADRTILVHIGRPTAPS